MSKLSKSQRCSRVTYRWLARAVIRAAILLLACALAWPTVSRAQQWAGEEGTINIAGSSMVWYNLAVRYEVNLLALAMPGRPAFADGQSYASKPIGGLGIRLNRLAPGCIRYSYGATSNTSTNEGLGTQSVEQQREIWCAMVRGGGSRDATCRNNDNDRSTSTLPREAPTGSATSRGTKADPAVVEEDARARDGGQTFQRPPPRVSAETKTRIREPRPSLAGGTCTEWETTSGTVTASGFDGALFSHSRGLWGWISDKDGKMNGKGGHLTIENVSTAFVAYYIHSGRTAAVLKPGERRTEFLGIYVTKTGPAIRLPLELRSCVRVQ